jgi:hypothetical protein
MARWLFSAQHPVVPQDRVVKIVGWARMVTGSLIVGILARKAGLVTPNPALIDVPVPFIALGSTWVGTGLLMIVLVLAADPDVRPQTLRRMRWPALSMLGVVMSFVVIAVIFGLAALADLFGFAALAEQNGPLAETVAATILIPIVIWMLVFFFCSFYLLLYAPFRGADGHPFLAPLIAIWFAWSSAIAGYIAEDLVSFPGWIEHLVNLSGPLTVTAISMWEIKRYRSRYDVSFRRPLWRPAQVNPQAGSPASGTTRRSSPRPLPRWLVTAVGLIASGLRIFGTTVLMFAILFTVFYVILRFTGGPPEGISEFTPQEVGQLYWPGLYSLVLSWLLRRYLRKRDDQIPGDRIEGQAPFSKSRRLP